MSKEAHPNIHAVGLTVDIIQSVDNRLRGDGGDYKKIIMGNKDINKKITDFVVDISVKIDEIMEEKGKKFDKKIEEAMSKNERNRDVPIGQK